MKNQLLMPAFVARRTALVVKSAPFRKRLIIQGQIHRRTITQSHNPGNTAADEAKVGTKVVEESESWRVGRAVDCTGLENRQGRESLGGSNPSLSAKPPAWGRGAECLRTPRDRDRPAAAARRSIRPLHPASRDAGLALLECRHRGRTVADFSSFYNVGPPRDPTATKVTQFQALSIGEDFRPWAHGF
jgi:hypothetical protein